MKLKSAFLAVAIAGISPAAGADLATDGEPAVASLPPAPRWSLGIEFSPEFYAIDEDPHGAAIPGEKSKKPVGGLASYSGKVSISHTFATGWVVGGSFEAEVKKNRDSSGNYIANTYQFSTEATLGYKFRWDEFTLTPSAGLGYTADATGIYGDVASSKDNDALYYVLYLAGDWKLNPQWTWNMFNLRYRNAFEYVWETPKVSTGVTFNIDSFDAVYANVGYSWKKLNESGQATSGVLNPNFGHLDGDKWNIAVGYKRAF